jgi:hypothetical protein
VLHVAAGPAAAIIVRSCQVPDTLLHLVAQDPVVTPDGYLYSREAILSNLLEQKKAIKRKLATWEKEQQEEQERVGPLCSRDSSPHGCMRCMNGPCWCCYVGRLQHAPGSSHA